jgi:hypothetical protein
MTALPTIPGLHMLTVPAHELRRGDIIARNDDWCTVARNDDSTEGETSTRSILLDTDDGRTWTLGIIATAQVAVLRLDGPSPVLTVHHWLDCLPDQVRARIAPDLAESELYRAAPAAALRLLATVRDERVFEHVGELAINWTTLLAAVRESGAFSTTVRLRVEIAASLAGRPEAQPHLRRTADALDSANWAALLDALRIAREGLER